MTARETIAYVDRSGGQVWLESGKLKYRLPQDRPDVLETLKANRDMIVGYLEAKIKNDPLSVAVIPRLPRHLESLVRAASTGVLPRGAMHLESGIAPDFQEHVTAWALAYLLGDRQHVLERLTQAARAWEASRLN